MRSDPQRAIRSWWRMRFSFQSFHRPVLLPPSLLNQHLHFWGIWQKTSRSVCKKPTLKRKDEINWFYYNFIIFFNENEKKKSFPMATACHPRQSARWPRQYFYTCCPPPSFVPYHQFGSSRKEKKGWQKKKNSTTNPSKTLQGKKNQCCHEPKIH